MFKVIKEAYSIIYTNVRTSIIFILKLSIALYFFTIIFSTLIKELNLNKNPLTNNKDYYVLGCYDEDYKYLFEGFTNEEDIDNFYNDLLCRYEKNISYYNLDYLEIKNFKGIENFLYYGMYGSDYSMVNWVIIDENFTKQNLFKIDSGRGFEKDDFKCSDESIPAILGYEYKNYYNLGDELEFKDRYSGIKKIKIVGFLEKDATFISNNIDMDSIEYGYINLNKYIILANQSIEFWLKNEIHDELNYNIDSFFLKKTYIRDILFTFSKKMLVSDEINSLLKKHNLEKYFYLVKLKPQVVQSEYISGNYNRFIGNELIEIIIIFIVIIIDGIYYLRNKMESDDFLCNIIIYQIISFVSFILYSVFKEKYKKNHAMLEIDNIYILILSIIIGMLIPIIYKVISKNRGKNEK